MTEQRYLAGGQEFFYPHAGDPKAPESTKLLLLTTGGICTTGTWNNNWCLGWLPLPKRNMMKEDKFKC
jgi:hypothetical protein